MVVAMEQKGGFEKIHVFEQNDTQRSRYRSLGNIQNRLPPLI